jgi:hypothetical protein
MSTVEVTYARARLDLVSIRRLLGALIVIISIGVPLIQSVDTWDVTLGDAYDTEMNVVGAALCVGVALSAAATVVIPGVRSLPTDARFQLNLPTWVRFVNPLILAPTPSASPPLSALRI